MYMLDYGLDDRANIELARPTNTAARRASLIV